MTRLSQITEEELAQYVELEEERKSLERKARSIAKVSAGLHDKIKAALEADGKQTAKRLGYLLTLLEMPGSVAWKPAFVERCGIEAANELIEKAPKRTKVSVQKAA